LLCPPSRLHLLDRLHVPYAVLAALGVRDGFRTPAADSADRLLAVLEDRELLLVLDNCEHLVEAAARLTAQLLAACPGVRVLATSRESLGITGEVLVAVPPLRPEPAVRLFLDRARAVRPDFEGHARVPDICAALARARGRAFAPPTTAGAWPTAWTRSGCSPTGAVTRGGPWSCSTTGWHPSGSCRPRRRPRTCCARGRPCCCTAARPRRPSRTTSTPPPSPAPPAPRTRWRAPSGVSVTRPGCPATRHATRALRERPGGVRRELVQGTRGTAPRWAAWAPAWRSSARMSWPVNSRRRAGITVRRSPRTRSGSGASPGAARNLGQRGPVLRAGHRAADPQPGPDVPATRLPPAGVLLQAAHREVGDEHHIAGVPREGRRMNPRRPPEGRAQRRPVRAIAARRACVPGDRSQAGVHPPALSAQPWSTGPTPPPRANPAAIAPVTYSLAVVTASGTDCPFAS
jgi:hypothetical protein